MTKLNSSFTTFLKAYKAGPEFLKSVLSSDMWVKSSVAPDSAYLLNHVYEFFAHNSLNRESDSNQALIFELRTELENQKQKDTLYPFGSFFNRNHRLKNEKQDIGFNIEKGKGVLAPLLIYIPLTEILILSFTVRLDKDSQSVDNLISLNYHLRVSKKGSVSSISTERRSHPGAQEAEEKIADRMDHLQGFSSTEDLFQWDINTLCSYFTHEMEAKIRDLSPSRLQAFVYSNLAEDIPENEFDKTFFRLRRIYSDNYVPSERHISQTTETAQTFEKVYYGASVEGAVVLVKPDDGVFLSNYESTVVQRTIWSYFLAFHQRMALISAADETNSLFRDNRNPEIHELSQLIDKLAKLQLKCLFEEVSHYSQQNEFYYLVLENLRVQYLFREVKEEVEELNMILSEKWREEEAAEREKREADNKQNQRKIEVLLALLIIPQIWFAVLSTNVEGWQDTINEYGSWVNIINGVIWVVIFGGVIRLFFLSRKDRRSG